LASFAPLKTGIQQRDLIKINSANGLGPTIFLPWTWSTSPWKRLHLMGGSASAAWVGAAAPHSSCCLSSACWRRCSCRFDWPTVGSVSGRTHQLIHRACGSTAWSGASWSDGWSRSFSARSTTALLHAARCTRSVDIPGLGRTRRRPSGRDKHGMQSGHGFRIAKFLLMTRSGHAAWLNRCP